MDFMWRVLNYSYLYGLMACLRLYQGGSPSSSNAGFARDQRLFISVGDAVVRCRGELLSSIQNRLKQLPISHVALPRVFLLSQSLKVSGTRYLEKLLWQIESYLIGIVL